MGPRRSYIDEVATLERELGVDIAPGVQVRVLRLKQGPPIIAPIEVLLTSSDLDELRASAREIREVIAEIEGLTMVRDSVDSGAPTIRFDLDPALSARRAVSDEALRASLLPYSSVGMVAGWVPRGQRDELVVIRGRGYPTDGGLPDDVTLAGSAGRLHVDEFARRTMSWGPASITRKSGQRFARVTAELDFGVDASVGVDNFRALIDERLAGLGLKDRGIELAFAGEVEGASKANSSLVRVLPIGLLILILVLVWEFDSLRCVALVLVTVPLAAIGVVPVLVVAAVPFGFMPALGVVALAGVVVNNAIVLLDLLQHLRREGMPTGEAALQATLLRARPILLTTATTAVGLIPLLLSGTSLWPPLALTIISGLLVSTLLTLITLPALAILVLPR